MRSCDNRHQEYYLREVIPGDIRLVETDYPEDYEPKPTPMPGSPDTPIWAQQFAGSQYAEDLELARRYINQTAERINNDPNQEWQWEDISLDSLALIYIEFVFGQREAGDAGQESCFELDALPTDRQKLHSLLKDALKRRDSANSIPRFNNYFPDGPTANLYYPH